MRAKRPYIVLSFRATVDAMAWEKRCIAEQIRCRGSCPPGAALRGGCCRRTGSAGGNDLIPPNTPPPRR